MNNSADVIEALRHQDGRLEKESIIRDAWDANLTDFFQGCQLAYDPMVVMGVKKIPTSPEGSNSVNLLHMDEFKILVGNLSTRKLTGHAARDAIEVCRNKSSDHMWNNFYRLILLKDFKCGITEKTINKVLKSRGKSATKFLIKTFSCQLAYDGVNYPEKIKGELLIDVKLDGCRIITVLNRETNSVVQYTRSGKINTNFGKITQKLEKLLPHIQQSLILDGEIISENFQSLMTQVNRKTNIDTSDAKLALFDIIPLSDFQSGIYTVCQRDRHELLVNVIDSFHKIVDDDKIYVIPKMTVDLNTEIGLASFREFNQTALENNFEGIMIKDPNAFYYTTKNFGWLKMKPFQTFDLEVVGFNPGNAETKNSHTLGSLAMRGEHEGKLIAVDVSGFSAEMRDDIWNNKQYYLGMIGEVEADTISKSENSDTYSLRFPRFKRWRGNSPGEKI